MDKRYAQAYANALRVRQTKDLQYMATQLGARIRAEKAKSNPNQQSLKSWIWQYNMVNAEIKRRVPSNRTDTIQQQQEQQSVQKPDDIKLGEKTLDELNKMLKEIEASLQAGGTEDSIKLRQAQMEAIKAEIKSRDKKVEQKAENDIQKVEGKALWSTTTWTPVLIAGGVAGGLGLLLAEDKANRKWWAISGLAIGYGIYYFFVPADAGSKKANV